MRVCVVGAGFSGIAMAIELRAQGIEDFTVYEAGPRMGGVWARNTYPGAACDVPSYLYSFSYAQRRDWTRPCSPQPEILGYLEQTAAEHGVADRIRTGTEVAEARYDEAAARWTLTTAAGEPDACDVLVLACGQLSRPAWPALEGEFGGHAFHSAQWDHGYDLRGKRVGVIGTGASAIQFVPEIAEQAAQLHVFQRSAPWLLPRRNPEYPALLRAAVARVPGLQVLRRLGLLAFMESGISALSGFEALRALLRTWSRTFMRMQLRDPEVRRRATPDYPFGCKRILFSSKYLPALQRPDVELVTEPIERLTPTGVRTRDGRERELDCVIYGTGFKAHDLVTPLEVHGRAGRTLNEAWRGGAQAHLGLTVPGFPNLFLLYGPNTNLGFGSIVVMIEAQVRYVADALRRLRRSGAAAVEVRPEVERAWDEATQERLRHSVWTQCHNWYRSDETGRIINNWPGLMAEYVRATRALAEDDYDWIARAA
jgi:cation diffusion facilitator CzcD-associated flavoprotein CzcO